MLYATFDMQRILSELIETENLFIVIITTPTRYIYFPNEEYYHPCSMPEWRAFNTYSEASQFKRGREGPDIQASIYQFVKLE